MTKASTSEIEVLLASMISEGKRNSLLSERTGTSNSEEEEELNPHGLVEYLSQARGGFNIEAIQNFVEKNRESYNLRLVAPELASEYQLATQLEFEAYLARPLILRFWKVRSIIQLSRAGFDSTNTQAVVHLGKVLGPRAGNGVYLSFARTDAGWTAKSRYRSWVA